MSDEAKTFENFNVTMSNHFAYARARRIAKRPITYTSPTFIVGPSGLGKTHLLLAIKSHLNQHFPELNVVYVSASEFTGDSVKAVPSPKLSDFISEHSDCDVLLFDDLEQIEKQPEVTVLLLKFLNQFAIQQKLLVIGAREAPEALLYNKYNLSRFRWCPTLKILDPNLEIDDSWKQDLTESTEALHAGRMNRTLRDAEHNADSALIKRRNELNKRFVWSDESKKHFLFIQDLLVSKYTAAWNEAVAISEELDKRIATGDPTLTDYEIYVELDPYMDNGSTEELDAYDDEFSVASRLTENAHKRGLREHMSYSHGKHEKRRLSILLEQDGGVTEPDGSLLCWDEGIEGIFDDDVRIAQIMYRLRCAYWAIEDILSIVRVWTNIEENYQSCTGIEPMEINRCQS